MNPWADLRHLPREMWILGGAVLVNRVGTMAQPFLVLYLTEHLGMRAAVAGMIAALYGCGSLVAAPLAGRLCDRYGALLPMLGSLFVSGLILMIYPLGRGVPALVLLTLGLAVAAEVFRPSNMVLVSSLVEPERRRAAFSLVRLAVNLGMSIGPAAGGFLAALWFPALFLIDGATSILAGAMLVASPLYARSRRVSPSPAQTRIQVGSAASDRSFRYFLIAIFPAGVALFQHHTVFPLFLVRELGQPEYVVGLMFTINTLLIVFLQVLLTSATEHWSASRSLGIGALLFGAGFLLLGVSQGVGMAVVSIVVWTFGEMFFMPGLFHYATEAAPEARRGQYIGLYGLVFNVAGILGPWSGAVMQESLGGRWLWMSAAACNLLSAALLTRLAQPRHR